MLSLLGAPHSVVAWGEFGRTPVINKDAGRDHWPQVVSIPTRQPSAISPAGRNISSIGTSRCGN
jgi:hypothetical protein